VAHRIRAETRHPAADVRQPRDLTAKSAPIPQPRRTLARANSSGLISPTDNPHWSQRRVRTHVQSLVSGSGCTASVGDCTRRSLVRLHRPSTTSLDMCNVHRRAASTVEKLITSVHELRILWTVPWTRKLFDLLFWIRLRATSQGCRNLLRTSAREGGTGTEPRIRYGEATHRSRR
jgi:hypothetical protein